MSTIRKEMNGIWAASGSGMVPREEPMQVAERSNSMALGRDTNAGQSRPSALSPPDVQKSSPNRLGMACDGKFLRVGGGRFYIRGVTYGTFRPNEQGIAFRSWRPTGRSFSPRSV